MNQQAHIYKRYTNQIKYSSIILLKQQQVFHNQQRSQQKISGLDGSNSLNNSIIVKTSNQNNIEPLVLKKFQQYFKRTTEPIKNIKILNKIIQKNTTLNVNKPSRYLPLTSRQLFKMVSKDKMFDSTFTKERKSEVYTSRSKKSNLPSNETKKKMVQLLQLTQQKDPNNSISPVYSRNTKRQRIDKSINLSKVLNSTTGDDFPANLLNSQFHLFSQAQDGNAFQDQGYLRIQKSYLTQRKINSTQLKLDENKNFSKQEELKKAIRTKIINRKRVLEDNYQDKLRSRSPSPLKYPKIMSFINYLNPLGKYQFTLSDLIKISLINSNIDEVKMNMNGCFFSVYVQEGNNSELIKAIVRSISGWRVAELSSVSNLVWTQNYRKNLLEKKPKKIIKQQACQNQNQQKRSRQKIIQKDKLKQSFLKSRKLFRNNSNSSSKSPKKSHHKLPNSFSRDKILPLTLKDQISPQLSLNKNFSQKQQYSFENQVKKLLPSNFQLDKYKAKNDKQMKKVTINPNFLIHNHLIGHRAISDKKNLLFNLRKYYKSRQINPFNFIPQSHDLISIKDSFLEKQNQMFVKSNNIEQMKKQVWIVKPGQDSNRGRGIVICKGWEEVIKEIGKRVKAENKQQNQIKKPQENNNNRKQNVQNTEISKDCQTKTESHIIVSNKNYEKSIILQKYIIPLLYQGRKFDIRSYMLVTWVNNVLNGYFYEECYIRTSSKQFDIDSSNKYVHLTNDAIQCMSHEYSKYQQGNKVSELIFQKYFNQYSEKSSKNKKFWKNIKQEMTLRCQDILKSSSKKLVGKFRIKQDSKVKQKIGYNMNESFLLGKKMTSTQKDDKQKSCQQIPSLFLSNSSSEKQLQMSFELFGLDFMIDENLKLWLIEVNTNPAISHDCSRVLNKLIPRLLQNTLQIGVMPFMRPSRISQNSAYINRYSHIYREIIQE